VVDLVEIDGTYVFPEVITAEWEGRPRCLPAALAYAASGWTVFPVPRGTKKSHKSAEHNNGRKWGATSDPDEIRRDYARWPDANVGIPCGAENRIWVFEVDTAAGHNVDGIASLNSLIYEHGELPTTFQVESPSGSQHFYFKWPADKVITNSASRIAPELTCGAKAAWSWRLHR
jgi:Bifunctional DNA primase/polymerase, N-terminal